MCKYCEDIKYYKEIHERSENEDIKHKMHASFTVITKMNNIHKGTIRFGKVPLKHCPNCGTKVE